MTGPADPGQELATLAEDLRNWLEIQGGMAAAEAQGELPTTSLPPELVSPVPPASAAPQRPAPSSGPQPPSLQPGAPGMTLPLVQKELGDCKRCGLHHERSNIVFGVGSPAADIVFVGEGPGYHEDQSGEPFVGKAGDLLTRIINNVLRLEREEVYICNVVKCRPPNNRDPKPDEVESCSPFLWKQLDAIQPAVVVGLGRFAVQTLLETTEPIGRLRGRAHPFRDACLVPTYHPAYLLRNPQDKRKVLDDMKLVRKEFEERTGRSLPPALSRSQAGVK
ncbi:MAG: uracil-DNA glycosylase [Myxococcota bacterium]|nr:uracil-DNA glycosylase [Myxococcota bacterium]